MSEKNAATTKFTDSFDNFYWVASTSTSSNLVTKEERSNDNTLF